MIFNKKSRFVVCLLIIVLLTGCNETKKNVQKSKVVSVQSGKVISTATELSIESFGNLSSDNSVDIKAQVSGQILKTYFEGGQTVNKGDLLIEIDSSTYEAKLENDEALLNENKADYKLKKFYVEKNKSLAEKGAMPAQDYEKMKAELAQAEAKIKVSEATIKLDKINLERCKIYSPLDGIVGIDSIGEGNVISENDSLVQINKINPINVDFTIPESNLLRLRSALEKKSLKVFIYVASIDRTGREKNIHEYEGSLKYLNNQTNTAGSTISLSASISNDDGYLLPGQYATVKLQLGRREDTKMVPVDSVQINRNGKYVYLINGENKVEMTNINTGRQYGNYIELISDEVKKGDDVVTVGQQNLTNNTIVKTTNEENDTSEKVIA